MGSHFLGFFGNLCNCKGIRTTSRSSHCHLSSLAIGLSSGSFEYYEELSLSEESSDKDGDKGGVVCGGTPTR